MGATKRGGSKRGFSLIPRERRASIKRQLSDTRYSVPRAPDTARSRDVSRQLEIRGLSCYVASRRISVQPIMAVSESPPSRICKTFRASVAAARAAMKISSCESARACRKLH
jgi:hypothetical protein